MNKRKFLGNLKLSIAHLPKHEINKALTYYAECIDDAIDDGMTEEDAVYSLDSISNIVRSIEESVRSTADNRGNHNKHQVQEPMAPRSNRNYDEYEPFTPRHNKNYDEYEPVTPRSNKNYDEYEFEPSVYDKSKTKVNNAIKKDRSVVKSLLLIATAVFWVPLLFAFAVTGIALIGALFMVILAFSFAMLVTVLAVGAAGIFTIVQGAMLCVTGMVHPGVAAIGIGLLMSGLALVLIKPSSYCGKALIKCVVKTLCAIYNKIFRGRAKV